jgi:mRNA interferase MazF
MRPICWATLDQRRPVLVLTRELMVGRMSTVTVAPITSTGHGIATEVPVGPGNGLSDASTVKCDQITSIPLARLHVHRIVSAYNAEQLARQAREGS